MIRCESCQYSNHLVWKYLCAAVIYTWSPDCFFHCCWNCDKWPSLISFPWVFESGVVCQCCFIMLPLSSAEHWPFHTDCMLYVFLRVIIINSNCSSKVIFPHSHTFFSATVTCTIINTASFFFITFLFLNLDYYSCFLWLEFMMLTMTWYFQIYKLQRSYVWEKKWYYNRLVCFCIQRLVMIMFALPDSICPSISLSPPLGNSDSGKWDSWFEGEASTCGRSARLWRRSKRDKRMHTGEDRWVDS